MTVPSCADHNDENESKTRASTVPLGRRRKFGSARKAPGGPPGNKYAVKHGYYTYKAMLDGDGLDERSSLFKALRRRDKS